MYSIDPTSVGLSSEIFLLYMHLFLGGGNVLAIQTGVDLMVAPHSVSKFHSRKTLPFYLLSPTQGRSYFSLGVWDLEFADKNGRGSHD